MKGTMTKCLSVAAAIGCCAAFGSGCSQGQSDGKVEIEIVQYKPEATAYFDALEEEFNATHEDIHLTIESQ